MQSVDNKVIKRIYGKKRGWVFTRSHFRDLGGAISIGKALFSLTNEKRIRRIARGLYDYPRKHPDLGDLAPDPAAVVKALSEGRGIRVQPSGAYALNLLGLTTQVPSKVVYLTDGGSRRIDIGTQTIELRRTTPRNMALAGQTPGLVIQALRHLGQQHVTEEIVERLRVALSDEDRGKLVRARRYAPVWMHRIFDRIAADLPQAPDTESSP